MMVSGGMLYSAEIQEDFVYFQEQFEARMYKMKLLVVLDGSVTVRDIEQKLKEGASHEAKAKAKEQAENLMERQFITRNILSHCYFPFYKCLLDIPISVAMVHILHYHPFHQSFVGLPYIIRTYFFLF